MAADEDDDLSMAGLFEAGHWYWNDVEGCLLFMSDQLPSVKEEAVAAAPQALAVSAFVFRDIDVIEQMRFKKRYQRKLKATELDIITLQDIKDLALYMAPLAIQSFSLINLLHIPTTERFIRGLILYCQYYLQIAQEMTDRVKALETQIRTQTSDEIEAVYRNDLCDLRSLVAKEYSTMLIGGQDTRIFHHMGREKKRRSLSDKDAHLIETFILMCVQIVWLALGRRSFNQLELEINRLFKSEIFNTVEHRLKTGYLKHMSSLERGVLIGQCARRETKLLTRSPFMNEVFCRYKQVDYRLMGIGAIQYQRLSPRLRYLLLAIGSPEAEMSECGVTVGILGKPRSYFDTALHLVHVPTAVSTTQRSQSSAGSTASSLGGKSTTGTSGTSRQSVMSKSASRGASRKSLGAGVKHKDTIQLYGYADIVLPEVEINEMNILPPTFPDNNAKPKLCSREQRMKWLNRLFRLLNANPNTARMSEVGELGAVSRSSRVDY